MNLIYKQTGSVFVRDEAERRSTNFQITLFLIFIIGGVIIGSINGPNSELLHPDPTWDAKFNNCELNVAGSNFADQDEWARAISDCMQ